MSSHTFADEVSFQVQAGNGGDGSVSFRREKFVAKGGPDGGDGGHGGNVYFVADHNLNTLADLVSRKVFKAEHGGSGRGQKSAGKAGADLIIKVPVGTQVLEVEIVRGKPKEFLIADLDRSGDKFLVAKGGEGGIGNARLARANFQTPRFAELGEPGETRDVVLKLKLVADVGLIGLPNVGKSTLLSVVSNARPKIANYQFTTLVPNLGIVKLSDRSFVVADIPGLIEGASKGKGLGTQFLRHIERTKILTHVLDATEPDLLQAFKAINSELKSFNPKLAQKPQIVVFNKTDAVSADRLAELKRLKFGGRPVLFVSAAAHQGVKELINVWAQHLPNIKQLPATDAYRIFTLRDLPVSQYHVEKKAGGFVVKGEKQVNLAIKTDFENYQATARFMKIMRRMGVLAALKKIGAKPGDIITIGRKQFTFEEI